MARLPDPIDIAEAKGSTRKNPGRYKARTTLRDALACVSDPPAHFLQSSSCYDQRLAIWAEYLTDYPTGFFTDKQQLATLVDLTIEARRIGSRRQYAAQTALLKELAALRRANAGIKGGLPVKAPKDELESFVRKPKKRA